MLEIKTTCVNSHVRLRFVVAARVDLEGPLRLQLSTSIGFMPSAYLNVINSVLVTTKAYDQDTANLINADLHNSLIWRTLLGWRPFTNWGFSFALGYELAAWGGELTGSQAVAAAAGVQPPSGQGNVDVQAKSTYAGWLGLSVGWRFY